MAQLRPGMRHQFLFKSSKMRFVIFHREFSLKGIEPCMCMFLNVQKSWQGRKQRKVTTKITDIKQEKEIRCIVAWCKLAKLAHRYWYRILFFSSLVLITEVFISMSEGGRSLGISDDDLEGSYVSFLLLKLAYHSYQDFSEFAYECKLISNRTEAFFALVVHRVHHFVGSEWSGFLFHICRRKSNHFLN